MQFSLQSLLLSFVLVASSLAAFGVLGIVVAALMLIVVASLRSNLSKAEKATILAIVAVLAALLLPPIEQARESARATQCLNNLSQIGLALQNYATHCGTFPPACIADADSKPMHSWRVLLLPYLGGRDLYEGYNFRECWDEPHNQKLAAAATPPELYRCPSDPGGAESGTTSYLAVVGADSAWPESKARRVEDLLAPDRTIVLVEVANSGVRWMEPRDLSIEEATALLRQSGANGLPGLHTRRYGYFYHDARGFHAAMADGSVRFLPADLAPEMFQEMLSVDKAAGVDLDAIDARRLNWSHIIALATLAVSFLLLLFRPRRTHRLPQP